MLNQVGLIRADNNRVQGHLMMKEALAPRPLRDPYVQAMFRREDGTVPDKLPGLMFFDVCKEVIGDIQDIQADEKNPNDCAKDPHEVTHTVDGVRYYCISRVLPAQPERKRGPQPQLSCVVRRTLWKPFCLASELRLPLCVLSFCW